MYSVLLRVPSISWIQPDSSHRKNPVCKGQPLVTQSGQGTWKVDAGEARGIINKMAFQSKGMRHLKDNLMSPFLSKQNNCLQILTDVISQLLHIKNLYGVLAGANLHVECWGNKVVLGIMEWIRINRAYGLGVKSEKWKKYCPSSFCCRDSNPTLFFNYCDNSI